MKELEAKGKGGAARQQMKADGTRVEPHQSSKEKQRRVNQGQGGMNKGGAIVPTQSTSITKAPTSSIQKAPTSAITKKPESKGGALATTGKVTPTRGTQRYSKSYKEASPKPPQKPNKPQKPRKPLDTSGVFKTLSKAGNPKEGEGSYYGQTSDIKSREKSYSRR
jgi:hypothetical protein